MARALHQALPPWGSTLELGALFFPSGSSSNCTVSASVDVAPAQDNVAAVLARPENSGVLVSAASAFGTDTGTGVSAGAGTAASPGKISASTIPGTWGR